MPLTQFLHSRLLLPCLSMLAAILAAAFAATSCLPLHAQAGKTISVLMLDGKTGRPIIPSNLIVRLDHLNAIHNELLKMNDDGMGIITVPPSASFLSIQGTYQNSMDTYINCDAGMEKDTSTLHWYSIADILTSGVSTPNECYKGKYAEATHKDNKPGVFVIYVRKNNWHEVPADF